MQLNTTLDCPCIILTHTQWGTISKFLVHTTGCSILFLMQMENASLLLILHAKEHIIYFWRREIILKLTIFILNITGIQNPTSYGERKSHLKLLHNILSHEVEDTILIKPKCPIISYIEGII